MPCETAVQLAVTLPRVRMSAVCPQIHSQQHALRTLAAGSRDAWVDDVSQTYLIPLDAISANP